MNIIIEKTENLESRLRSVGTQIELGKRLFDEICSELRKRKETRDEQPEQTEATADQAAIQQFDALMKTNNTLVLKIIAMESEQAKLVVEAESAKAAQVEAERRLAILAKVTDETWAANLVAASAATRTPLTKEEASALATVHLDEFVREGGVVAGEISSWVVDAIVDASR